jgi:hypothetical protein
MSIEVNNISKSYGKSIRQHFIFLKRRNRWFLGTEWSWKIYFNENTNDLYFADEGTAL